MLFYAAFHLFPRAKKAENKSENEKAFPNKIHHLQKLKFNNGKPSILFGEFCDVHILCQFNMYGANSKKRNTFYNVIYCH